MSTRHPYREIKMEWHEGAYPRRIYNWADVKTINVKGGNLCTSCHRIGDQRTCEDFMWFAVGRGNRGSTIRAERDEGDVRRLGKPLGTAPSRWTFPHNVIMPPDHRAASEREWDAQYLNEFAKIAYCCGGSVNQVTAECETKSLIRPIPLGHE